MFVEDGGEISCVVKREDLCAEGDPGPIPIGEAVTAGWFYWHTAE